MNTGHGHVTPREDGVRMRCGGPNICQVCWQERAALHVATVAGNPKQHLSDKDLLDWLEQQNAKASYTGRCVFRWSTTSRGWRLHEHSGPEASSSVREAITKAIRQELHSVQRLETESRIESLRQEAADLEEKLQDGHGWGV